MRRYQALLLQESLQADDDALVRTQHQQLAAVMRLDGEVDAAALDRRDLGRSLDAGADRRRRQVTDVDRGADRDFAVLAAILDQFGRGRLDEQDQRGGRDGCA